MAAKQETPAVAASVSSRPPTEEVATEEVAAPLSVDPVVRGALIVLALLAVIYTLALGKQVLLPIVTASLLASASTPALAGLRRLGFPPPLAAATLLVVGAAAIVYGATLVSGPAVQWLERAPTALMRLEAKAKGIQDSVKEVTEATEKATALATGQGSGERIQPVEIVGSRTGDMLFSRTMAMLFLGAATLVLLFFLLLDGDTVLYKIVGLIPATAGKLHVICLAQDVRTSISHYLLTILSINTGLGIVTGVTMWLLDVPNPVLWGAVAGLFNFAPYLGAMATTTILAVVSALEFTDPWRMAAAPAAFLCITAIEGSFLTPWILGRRLELNPVAVFISIIFWGWIWGIPGALLATPLLAALKITSDRISSLGALAAFLGR